MQTLKLTKEGTLILPKSLQAIFRPSDKLSWFREGATLIIKKINPPKLSTIAQRRKANPQSLKEINKEIRAYRNEKSRR